MYDDDAGASSLIIRIKLAVYLRVIKGIAAIKVLNQQYLERNLTEKLR